MNFSFFHLYGFILGIAVWVTILLAEYKAKQIHFSEKLFWELVVWEFVGGVIGARAYHVWTDFPLYQHHFWKAFYIWQGGLSILGVLIGCVGTLFLYVQTHRKRDGQTLNFNWKVFADVCVFGAPFGQAIGRFGNFFNQE